MANWFDSHIIELLRHLRLSYPPPLMVYPAAGISGLTGIVGTFFVKDYLGLPAEFMVMLGFWAGIPWALKMPLGHLVDSWRESDIYHFYSDDGVNAGPLQPGNYFCRINGNRTLSGE